jgi:hypothetical protein
MDWSQFGIFLISVGGMFLWSRSESRSDHRALESWTKDMLSSIQAEIKDFHGRLCALEEKNKNKDKKEK